MTKSQVKKVQDMCRYYRTTTPVVTRLYMILHLLYNQKENFSMRSTKEIDQLIASLSTMISRDYIRTNKGGRLTFYTNKTPKPMREYSTKEQLILLNRILYDSLEYYSKNLKKVKKFNVNRRALQNLSATGHIQMATKIDAFLSEARKVLS